MSKEMINTLISVVSSQLSTLLRGILSLHTACLAGEYQEREYSAIGTWVFVLPPNKYSKQVLHNFSGELAELIFKASYLVIFKLNQGIQNVKMWNSHLSLLLLFTTPGTSLLPLKKHNTQIGLKWEICWCTEKLRPPCSDTSQYSKRQKGGTAEVYQQGYKPT